tara:strand:- start:404 stop:535 length:132 start_codon:yes stop_codon:yes gene_type:complete
MNKYFILLFIGLAWGQSDSSIKEKAVLDAKRDVKNDQLTHPWL